MENQEILRVSNGTTATISYDCLFGDNTKKTISVGSFRIDDLPGDLPTRIKNFNSNVPEGFSDTFVSASSGEGFNSIIGATITVKRINVLI